jgi:ABC-type transport system substrate-binding protein
MTTEEKAKAYDEAYKRARDYYEKGYFIINAALVNIFPELKESEDERIRKALVEMVHDTTGDELWVDYNVHKENAIAWLEKQGETYTKKDVDDFLYKYVWEVEK